MKKKTILLIGLLLILTTLTGCSKNEKTASMTAYTSVYPVEYILDNLYGENIAISSIYPDGVKFEDYNLTDVQLNNCSKSDLYIYNGIIPKEQDYAVNLINKNKKLKIIDASKGMNYITNTEEAWLNPSNYLMMASNIKNGLEEYIKETIELNKINENYNKLKLALTEIDAELKMIGSNADNNILIVSNDTFKYLEKYGFKVISLEENDNLTDKVIADVKNIIANKKVHYIFLKDNEEETELIKELKNSYGISTVKLNSLSTLSAEQRREKQDYISIMMENINSIKLETNH